mgnify:CR=1 FL=1
MTTDVITERDRPLAFYFFTLPAWQLVAGWLMTLAVIACAVAGFFIVITGGGRVLVDRKSYLYLVDTVVDYAESLQNAGFQIQNPNVKSTCGCGESFVV